MTDPNFICTRRKHNYVCNFTEECSVAPFPVSIHITEDDTVSADIVIDIALKNSTSLLNSDNKSLLISGTSQEDKCPMIPILLPLFP